MMYKDTIFFRIKQKMYRYIFVHNSYTLTFKLLENSHTRTIHKRYTNYRHQIDDIPSKPRDPGMKQTTVYHHFSANMIAKK